MFQQLRVIRARGCRLACAGVAATVVLVAGLAAAASASDATTNARQDTGSALVQLNGDPLSTYPKTKPAKGKKIDFNNGGVKAYRAQLSALRNDYKAWLHTNAPQAKVTNEFDISLNAVAVQLNGASLQQISATPLVKNAQYEGLYRPIDVDPDLAAISAIPAWGGGGAANAGAGIKVAIVDTGIDVTHPCFADTGYVAQTQLGDKKFTNNKVFVAKVFNNKTPSQHYTAEPLQEHGTHVAGTVACNYGTAATVDGATIPHNGISGVAPSALLGNYNIFPADVENARSEDILNALEAAYADGFDVANMSLGGGAHGMQDLLTVAVDNLDQANMVVAVAAGNSGPGLFTVESPGSAARALTAGASTVNHLVAAPLTVANFKYAAVSGEFAVVSTDLTAPLNVVAGTTNGLNNACTALPSGSLAGAIALVTRGACAFTIKVRNAQAAGAAAVIVANNAPGDAIIMATDGTPDQPTIPAYMVSQSDGQALIPLNGFAATIGAAFEYIVTTNVDLMAGFSSQGPTDVDFRVKPDVVAPGVNVLSSIPHQFCDAPPCFAFFQGTSMATPHLAGSAAVVLSQHPGWSAAEVRSAIVNTADRGVLKNYATGNLETEINVTGAGRENLQSAVGAAVAVDPVSVSFGAVPSGSGQVKAFDVTLRNLGSSSATWQISASAGDASVAYAVSPKTLALGPGESATVTVTMTAGRPAAPGGHAGWLEIKAGATAVGHAALYTLIK